MRIGIVMEEVFNPRMKASSSIYKLFKHLNNTYLDEVFQSMDDEEGDESTEPSNHSRASTPEGCHD
jgi:hypothetical protein